MRKQKSLATFSVYSGTEKPTNKGSFYKKWEAAGELDKHVGDFFHDKTEDKLYRFQYRFYRYYWKEQTEGIENILTQIKQLEQ